MQALTSTASIEPCFRNDALSSLFLSLRPIMRSCHSFSFFRFTVAQHHEESAVKSLQDRKDTVRHEIPNDDYRLCRRPTH